METFFFSTGARPLFGAHHEATGAARDHGVIFAYPGPQEYMYAHYGFRLLATQLAQAGFPVLRFDWSGTGDSAGETEQACLADWRRDLQAAEEELRDVAHPARVSVVAFRLGAIVAATTPFRAKLARLLLWEPVVNGRDYLAELRTIERYKLARKLDPPAWWNDGSEQELLGHPLTRAQRTEIEAADLLQTEPRCERVDIVTDRATIAQQSLVAALGNRGIPATMHEVNSPDAARRSVMLSGVAMSEIVGALKSAS